MKSFEKEDKNIYNHGTCVIFVKWLTDQRKKLIVKKLKNFHFPDNISDGRTDRHIYVE